MSDGARRVAANSAIQAGGEIASKVLMLVLYSVMARAVGPEAFGDFTSASSLALFITIAAFGTDFTTTKLVARADAAAGQTFWNGVVIKLGFGLLGLGLVVLIAVLGSYPARVVTATAVLGAAMIVDLTTMSLQAVFRGVERTLPIAKGQVLQRLTTAVTATVALALGASILQVCVLWLAGSLVALLYAGMAARRMGVTYPLALSAGGVRTVLADSFALGLSAAFGGALSRLDVVMLGLMKSSSAVALYGSAYRLFESTFFLAAAFSLASFPVLSRLTRTSSPTLGEAYAHALKVVLVVTAPLAVLFAAYAEPVTRLVYGPAFDDAAIVLQLLAPGIVCVGVFLVTCNVLAAQDRQRSVLAGLLAGAVSNVGLNLALVPAHAANGAAVAMPLSMLVSSGVLVGLCRPLVGRLSPLRILLGPTLATAAMAGAAIALGPHLLAAVPVVGVFAAILALVEQRFAPEDMALVRRMVQRRVHPTTI